MTDIHSKKWRNKFNSDQIIILGSGGGRYMCKKQYRSTGGMIFQCLGGKLQCHIDPGPGAIRDINDYGIDPIKTQYIILTHMHTDHCMSIPIIIESSQPDHKYRTPTGTLVAPKSYLKYLDPYYQKIMARIIPPKLHKQYQLQKDFRIIDVTPTHHDNVENYGYIFEIGNKNGQYNYTIGFTSDTQTFDGYVKYFKEVDILVANVLRPDDKKVRGHITVNEFIPLLKQIRPKICITTHYGGYMDDSSKNPSKLEREIRRMQEAVGNGTIVVKSEDGRKFPFASILSERN